MAKMKLFTGLDFITLKAFLGIKNLLIFGGLAVYMVLIHGSVTSSLGIGLMIAVLFAGYPFAVGEKCNMDALYATLAIDRKGVVAGRYLFVFIMNVCTVAAMYIVSTAALLVLKLTNFLFAPQDESTALVFTAIAVASLLIQSLQLPLFFKFGYTKAKLFALLPFGAMMVAFIPFTIMGVQLEFLGWVAENKGVVILAAITILAVIVFVSYNLSLAFYKRMEF